DPAFVVGKAGSATDFTVGRYAGLDAYLCSKSGKESVEVAIYNYNHSYNHNCSKATATVTSPSLNFAAPGDSGSLVFTGDGRMLAILHSAMPRGPYSHVAFGTPAWWAVEQLKGHYKHADFDPPANMTSVAPVKVSSAAPSNASPSAHVPSSASVKRSLAASSSATVKVTTTKISSSLPTSSTSASIPSTSPVACAIKRAGTAGVSAAASCGTRDPCDDSCDTNVQDLSTQKRAVLPEDEEPEIRTIYGNDTSPFFPGEHIRIRIIEKRAEPTLEFDCTIQTGIPEVCQKMCYGIKCQDLPQTLTRRTQDRSQCSAARRRNSCGATSPNRCSARFTPPFEAGHSCDEYPFASTLQGQEAGKAGKPVLSPVASRLDKTRPKVERSRISTRKRTAILPNKVPEDGKFQIDFSFGPNDRNGNKARRHGALRDRTQLCTQ
ncbi:hypothetical protein EVG20_g8663, partial [Dentipellis fragilis]